ncbi:MAG TPA: acyl carrier protein [Spongiibacteraceae bacterium]|jgi:acyl carrier protein
MSEYARVDAFEIIKSCIAQSLPELAIANITEDVSLSSLGVDSIKLVEISVRIEEAFGEKVVIDDWIDEQMNLDVDDRYTIRSLIEFVELAHA